MTSTPMPVPGTPSELLATTRKLTRTVRNAQRVTWFPLLVLALVTLAETPLERYGHRVAIVCTPHTGLEGYSCNMYQPGVVFYWPVALTAAYIAISVFYLRRARRAGIGTRVWPYVAAGIVLAIALTALALWVEHDPNRMMPYIVDRTIMSYEAAVPIAAISLSLLVLAWIERSPVLAAFTAVYFVLVMGSGQVLKEYTPPGPWNFLPHQALAVGILSFGSLGFWLAHRRTSTGAPRAAESDAE